MSRAPVLSRLIDKNCGIQRFYSERAVCSDAGVMAFAAIFPHVGMVGVLDERIGLRRVHATIRSPVLRTIRNSGKLVFDRVKGLCQQIERFISGRRRRGGTESFEKDLKSFSFR